jgi:hypothetical protein
MAGSSIIELLSFTCTPKTNWQFGGAGRWDANSPFTYHPNRFRDGERFVNFDTFEADPTSPGNLHKYLFAGSNPVICVDPTGHENLVSTLASMGISALVFTMRFVAAHKLLVTSVLVAGAVTLASYEAYKFAHWKPVAGINCMQYATSQYLDLSIKQAFWQGIVSRPQLIRWTTGDDRGDQRLLMDLYQDPQLARSIVSAMFGSQPVSDIGVVPAKRKVSYYIYYNPGINGGRGGYDYHWITQHADGTWSGKHGPTGPIEMTSPAEQAQSKKYIGTWLLDVPPAPRPSN